MLLEAASTVTLDANTIILAVINLAGLCVTGFLALRQAAIAAEQKAQKEAQVVANESLKEIHVAVNSGKTANETQIAGLQKLVLELSGTIKTLEENKRGAELAKAVASVPPVTPAIPAPVSVVATVAPATAGEKPTLKEAITDLTEAAKDTVAAADKTVELVVKVPHT